MRIDIKICLLEDPPDNFTIRLLQENLEDPERFLQFHGIRIVNRLMSEERENLARTCRALADYFDGHPPDQLEEFRNRKEGPDEDASEPD